MDDFSVIGEPVHPGEYELKWALREHGYKVKDVSMDPQYWHEDVDLIATNIFTDAVTKIEVKWDKRLAETGNFFIEINNPKGECGKGWFKICQADILAYGDAINKIFYMIEFPKLKEYINENESSLEMRRTWDGSEGYVLPVGAVAAFTTTFDLKYKRGE